MSPNYFIRTIRSYAGRLHAIRTEMRTERFLNGLPADIRKDIGWPCRFDDRGPERP